MSHITIVKTFLRSNKWRVAGCFILDCSANLLTLLLPLLAAQAISLLLGYSSVRAETLAGAGLLMPSTFPALMSMFGITLVVKAALDFFRKRQQGILTEDFAMELRQSIFQRHLQLAPSEYELRGIGRYLLRFSGDLGSAQQFLSKGILQFSADISLLGAGLVLIGCLNSRLGIVVTGWLGGLTILFWLLNAKVGVVEKNRRNKKSAALDFVNRRLINIQTVKALNRQGMEMALFRRRTERLRRLGHRVSSLTAVQEAVFPLAIYGLAGAVLLLGWQQPKTFYPAQLFAVLMILIAWRPVLLRLLRAGLIWKKGNISLTNIARVFNQPTEPLQQIMLKKSPGQLILKNIPLKNTNIELTLSLGETTVLPIENEEARRALLRYLSGLENPASGDIYLDDTDMSQLGPKSYRRYVAIASTTFPLYGNTVGEALSNSSRKENKLKAAVQFDAWKVLFPVLQPLNLDTPLRETTANLTPAQHNLLVLLRALLTEKPFLILEGIFNHLDASSSNVVLCLLKKDQSRRAQLILSAGADKDAGMYKTYQVKHHTCR